MDNIATRMKLGSCILLGLLGAARSARADVWYNLKAETEGHAICMGIAGGDPGGHVSVGTSIIVWDCNYSSDQIFQPEPFGYANGAVQLQDFATDPSGNSVCLADNGGSNDRGTQLKIADCNASSGQQFTLDLVTWDAAGYPCYLIRNPLSSRYVGVANAQSNPVKDGMSVVIWDFTSSLDQMWCDHPNPSITIN